MAQDEAFSLAPSPAVPAPLRCGPYVQYYCTYLLYRLSTSEECTPLLKTRPVIDVLLGCLLCPAPVAHTDGRRATLSTSGITAGVIPSLHVSCNLTPWFRVVPRGGFAGPLPLPALLPESLRWVP